MNGNYSIVNLVQDSQEWKKWRHNGITATDAPIIMGENPWKSTSELLQKKTSPPQDEFINDSMRRGMELEPIARRTYNSKYGKDVRPVCLQSDTHDWLKASIDGLSFDGRTVAEFKSGESVYKSALNSKVPDYYYGQLQHILAITGLPAIDFFCYLPDRPTVLIKVDRNNSYITRLIDEEQKFWRKVLLNK
jgi:putative phage-type endonuclease